MASIYNSVVSSRPLPISVKRPSPWNRWFFKAIHYWRYGYSHPDEDLLGVIEAVGDALKVYTMSACAEFQSPQREQAEGILRSLTTELDKEIPDFSILLGLEAALNALYPPELIKYRRWVVRERFERVASPNAIQSWRAALVASQIEQANARPTDGAAPDAAGAKDPGDADGSGQGGGGSATSGGGGASGGQNPPAPPGPPGPAGAPVPPQEHGDVQVLLSYVHSNYLLSIAREKAVRDLKRWLLMRFWFFLLTSLLALAVVGGILLLLKTQQYWGLFLGLFLVAIAGRIGATTSVIRRMQTAISGNVLARDPILELTALRTGKNEITLALLTSSIFALLLYAFFLTGVPRMLGFQEGIFPQAATSLASTSAPQGEMDPSKVPGTSQNTLAAQNQAATGPSGIALDVAPAGNTGGAEPAGYMAQPATSPNVRAAPAGNTIQPAAMLNGSETAAPGNATASATNNMADAGAAATRPKPQREAQGNEAQPLLNLKCQPGVDCDPFDDLAWRLGLMSAQDFFKLLIWAFIAGFAERFVPDVLDRVVSRTRRSSEETDLVIATQLTGRGAPPGAPAPGTATAPPPAPERPARPRRQAREDDT